MKTNTHLLFFDIDGTLLTEGKRRYISDETLLALDEAKRAGHFLFINTGRTYAELGERLRQLPVHGFICGCGTQILIEGKELFHQTIEPNLCQSVIRDLKQCKLEGLLEASDYIYYDKIPYTSRMQKIRNEQLQGCKYVIENFDDPSILFDKFCFCTTDESNYSLFYETYKDVFSFIDRGASFYEIVPKNLSKATGMQFLEKHYRIPNEHTIAFGDSTNDTPMLSYAGKSVAMENHSPALDEIVDFVTGPVESSGIFDAMKYFDII